MGLDVLNAPFGNFHLSWTGTSWFSEWCDEHDLPNPFIGWVSGCNDGDQCVLGPGGIHTRHAPEWCDAFETKFPDIARMGRELLAGGSKNLDEYLFPHRVDAGEPLTEHEWSRRALAAWYAILRNGVERGDTLEYW